MPHQCVRCNTMFPDGAKEILQGCSCGARLFFYIKKKQVEAGKELISNLSEKDKEHIASDVREILHIKEDPDRPVVLDIESIRILEPGKSIRTKSYKSVKYFFKFLARFLEIVWVEFTK